MSDGLTSTTTVEPTPTARTRARRSGWRGLAGQVLAILGLFALAGPACGGLWYRLWDPPTGRVADGVWFTDETGLRASFSGVALYVAIGVLAGLVLGTVCAWRLDRSELATLLAVLAGSVLAAYLMLRVGQHLSPPDPQVLARSASDGTRLRGALRVDSWPPRGAFPFGALLGVAVVFAGSLGRAPTSTGATPSTGPAPPSGRTPPEAGTGR